MHGRGITVAHRVRELVATVANGGNLILKKRIDEEKMVE
jgi:hypothetical protein